MSRYSNRTNSSAGNLILVSIFIFVIMLGGLLFFDNTQNTVYNVVVQDKERVIKNDNSYYLIFTNTETFKNTDTIFALKFNSSDIYGQLKQGCTYTFDVYGLRIPFLSMYRNIIHAYNEQCN